MRRGGMWRGEMRRGVGARLRDVSLRGVERDPQAVREELRDDGPMIGDPLRDAQVVTIALGGDSLGEAGPQGDDMTRIEGVHVGGV